MFHGSKCLLRKCEDQLIRGVTRGENHYGGRQMTAGHVEKSQQCHKQFFNTAHLLPKDLELEHGGAKLSSCPGVI